MKKRLPSVPAVKPALPPPTTVARRHSSGQSGENGEDQFGLLQLFQPDNVPRVTTPIAATSSSPVAVAIAAAPETTKDDVNVVKTEGNTFRTKFKVWISTTSFYFSSFFFFTIAVILLLLVGGVHWLVYWPRLQEPDSSSSCLLWEPVCGEPCVLLPQEVGGERHLCLLQPA